MNKFKFTFLILFSLVFISCESKNDLNNTSENNNIIRVGTSGGYFPFTYYENDVLKGFEIDVWNEIAKKLNKKVEFTTSKFSGLFGLLDTGKIDTISNQITMTEARKEKYTFVTPYVYDGASIIVHKDTNDVKSLKDLKGKKVGVGLGTNYAKIIKEFDKNNEIKVITYDGNGYQQDVRLKRIDAYIEDRTSAVEGIKKANLPFKVVGQSIKPITNSFPFLKTTDKTLIEEIDKAIKELKENGTLKKLSIKWFGTDITDK